jgi:hypothetical protein
MFDGITVIDDDHGEITVKLTANLGDNKGAARLELRQRRRATHQDVRNLSALAWTIDGQRKYESGRQRNKAIGRAPDTTASKPHDDGQVTAAAGSAHLDHDLTFPFLPLTSVIRLSRPERQHNAVAAVQTSAPHWLAEELFRC